MNLKNLTGYFLKISNYFHKVCAPATQQTSDFTERLRARRIATRYGQSHVYRETDVPLPEGDIGLNQMRPWRLREEIIPR